MRPETAIRWMGSESLLRRAHPSRVSQSPQPSDPAVSYALNQHIHLISKSASHKVSPASKRGLKILFPDALMMALAYIVCTSPRTGSTLLCQGLSHSGRAGAPTEFFDHRTEVEEYWRRHYGIDRESDYVSGIIVATSTSNGVFGTKLHWSTLLNMYRALRGSPGSPSAA